MIYKIILSFSIVCLSFFSSTALKAENALLDSIVFQELKYDFGVIKQDTIYKHMFEFENLGDSTVFIKDVVTQCGCTVGNYEKGIILPTQSSSLEISFNTTGKYGYQRKSIRVIFSNGEVIKLSILAQIN